MKKQLLILLGAMDIKDALNTIINCLDRDPNFIVMLSGYNSALNDFHAGMLTSQEFSAIQRKTMNGLLYFVDQLPNGEIQKIYSNLKGEIPTVDNKPKFLFVAASPSDLDAIQSGVEFRKISAALNHAPTPVELCLPVLGARFKDIIYGIAENRPSYIHFSGHGEKQGLRFQNDRDEWVNVDSTALSELFTLYKDILAGIFLNACYSAEQAKIISSLGIPVVGMNRPVSDDTASDFASSFYTLLGKGEPFDRAFALSCVELQVSHWDEIYTPELWRNGTKQSLETSSAN